MDRSDRTADRPERSDDYTEEDREGAETEELEEAEIEALASPDESHPIPGGSAQRHSLQKVTSGSSPMADDDSARTDLLLPRAGALSVYDPLKRYLEEVRHYPLLEPEEELRLALELREKGSVDAARRLVQANLRLVIKIAFEYQNFYSNIMDLIQEGNYGLMKAVSKFDPGKGAKLSYYASWWIRSYILKYLLDNFRLVKVGTSQTQKKLFYHLMREKERLEAQGLLAGPAQLAQTLQVPEKDIIEMQQRLSSAGAELSLDAPIDTDSGKSRWVDQLSDASQDPEGKLTWAELIHQLRSKLPSFLKGLNQREKDLMADRMLSDEPLTLQEIADRYGLTRERARQIEAKVIDKLRAFLGLEGEALDLKKGGPKTPKSGPKSGIKIPKKGTKKRVQKN